eukprot:4965494-Pyramimonas_sp.AAC.1
MDGPERPNGTPRPGAFRFALGSLSPICRRRIADFSSMLPPLSWFPLNVARQAWGPTHGITSTGSPQQLHH